MQCLSEETAFWVEKGLVYAERIGLAVLLLLVGWIVIRLIRATLVKALQKGVKKETLLTTFVVSVVSKALWAVLIVLVLGRIGVEVGPLIAGLGVTGFIIGFACQESLGNLASGIMIALNQPFRVGDAVNVAGNAGTVREVNMMATVLVTPDNHTIVIPNKSAWGSPIVNYTVRGQRRGEFKIGIAYGENVARATKIALDAIAAKVPAAMPEPAPAVVVASFDDSAVTLGVRVWAKNDVFFGVMDDSMRAVKEAFDANGISIPFPQLDVHLDK